MLRPSVEDLTACLLERIDHGLAPAAARLAFEQAREG